MLMRIVRLVRVLQFEFVWGCRILSQERLLPGEAAADAFSPKDTVIFIADIQVIPSRERVSGCRESKKA